MRNERLRLLQGHGAGTDLVVQGILNLILFMKAGSGICGLRTQVGDAIFRVCDVQASAPSQTVVGSRPIIEPAYPVAPNGSCPAPLSA